MENKEKTIAVFVAEYMLIAIVSIILAYIFALVITKDESFKNLINLVKENVMKQHLISLWGKIVEHKPEVIKATAAVGGAIIGLVLATIISQAYDMNELLEEEIVMSIEED